ncbi:MAG: FAD-dependent oxidoreductase [Lentisphaerota bacterium]
MSAISSFATKTLSAEFCVAGGGMAGVCTALAAARNGIKTILLQDRPVLGGNSSSEIRMWICGADKPDNREAGILEELQLENLYRNPKLLYSLWDHVLYGKCIEQENLTLVLNCAVNDVTVDESGKKISSVKAWHLTEQCYYQVDAGMFADCSGDSVLRSSGAEFRRGREARSEFNESHAPEFADDKTMGNSILIQLRQTDHHVPFIPPDWANRYTVEDLPNRPLSTSDNFWWLEIGGVNDTINDADMIRDELFKMAYGVWTLIKNHPDGRGHKWELDWIGSLPGKRENIRYVGDHILTQNDVEAEGRFDDIVAYGGWPMDDHHPEAIKYPGKPTIFHRAPSPFGIPFRCLYSKNIDNLLFAGRNISATHMAMSATRVMSTCSIMGQAAGTAAAIAIKNSLTPRGVYEQKIAELQDTLIEQDCYIPWHVRKIPDLTMKAALTVSSDSPDNLLNGIERGLADNDNGWWGNANETITCTWKQPVKAERIRIVFDSDFSGFKRMRCNYPKDYPPATMPTMLAKDFDIEICSGNTWETIYRITNNRRRLVMLELPDGAVSACRMRLKSAWGGDKTHVFSFEVI